MSDNNYQKWLHGELSDSDLSHRQVGVFQERERIAKAVINNSTQLADLYKLGLVNKAEALLSALIKGEQK